MEHQMERTKDFTRFIAFMSALAQGTPDRGKIDEDVLEVYFRLLEDMPIEAIETNSILAVRENGWFPKVNDIRREKDTQKIVEAKADEAYNIITELLENYYFQGFGQSSMAIIEQKLNEMNRPELFRLVHRWGPEIVNNQNPTATRAQFLKSFAIQENEWPTMIGEKPENQKRIDGLIDQLKIKQVTT